MKNKEYLNEENYQKNNKTVKKIGKILLPIGIIILIIGIIFIVIGFSGLGNTTKNIINTYDIGSNNAFGNIGLFALGGFMTTIGFGLIMAGAIAMIVAHRREITAYTVQQTMPIAQEGIEKMAPTIGNAAGTIAKSIKDSLKD